MPNKNLSFLRLKDIGCSFDFQPKVAALIFSKKNKDALSAMYNKNK